MCAGCVNYVDKYYERKHSALCFVIQNVLVLSRTNKDEFFLLVGKD